MPCAFCKYRLYTAEQVESCLIWDVSKPFHKLLRKFFSALKNGASFNGHACFFLTALSAGGVNTKGLQSGGLGDES